MLEGTAAYTGYITPQLHFVPHILRSSVCFYATPAPAWSTLRFAENKADSIVCVCVFVFVCTPSVYCSCCVFPAHSLPSFVAL